MKTQELALKLKEDAALLKDERIERVNFDELLNDLQKASETLINLAQKEDMGNKLLSDFKSEIKRMALALSKTVGDKSNLDLVENLLSCENLGFEDLTLLKRQVKSEFDKAFPSQPVSRIGEKMKIDTMRIEEFRTGVK
jgi:hypothetical protein